MTNTWEGSIGGLEEAAVFVCCPRGTTYGLLSRELGARFVSVRTPTRTPAAKPAFSLRKYCAAPDEEPAEDAVTAATRMSTRTTTIPFVAASDDIIPNETLERMTYSKSSNRAPSFPKNDVGKRRDIVSVTACL